MSENSPWMCPNNWKYYGPLLHKTSSYAEFVMLSVISGYVNPDTLRRSDETLLLYCRREPYEEFIYSEAGYYRGKGILTRKAQKFRDEMIKLEIENGERDKDGVIIPTKLEIEHSKQLQEWCKKYHLNFFKIRGVECKSYVNRSENTVLQNF